MNGIFWFVFMLAVVYWFVVRPWRRDHKLGLDSLIVLAFYWTWWQDPLFDYLTHAWNYSAVNLNMGGWAGHIPGWDPGPATGLPGDQAPGRDHGPGP